MVIQDKSQKAKSWSPLEVMPIISRLWTTIGFFSTPPPPSFSISNSKSAFSQLKLQFYELLHLRELIGSLAFFRFFTEQASGWVGGEGLCGIFINPLYFNNTTKRSFPSMLFIQSSPFTMTNKHSKRWLSCRLLKTC